MLTLTNTQNRVLRESGRVVLVQRVEPQPEEGWSFQSLDAIYGRLLAVFSSDYIIEQGDIPYDTREHPLGPPSTEHETAGTFGYRRCGAAGKPVTRLEVDMHPPIPCVVEAVSVKRARDVTDEEIALAGFEREHANGHRTHDSLCMYLGLIDCSANDFVWFTTLRRLD